MGPSWQAPACGVTPGPTVFQDVHCDRAEFQSLLHPLPAEEHSSLQRTPATTVKTTEWAAACKAASRWQNYHEWSWSQICNQIGNARHTLSSWCCTSRDDILLRTGRNWNKKNFFWISFYDLPSSNLSGQCRRERQMGEVLTITKNQLDQLVCSKVLPATGS